jgi:hypothetical protein
MLFSANQFRKTSAAFLFFLLAFLPALASAQTTIWSQPWDHRSQYGPSSQTTTDPIVDREVADDFDVVGQVEAIYADGSHITYFGSPAMQFTSAYVRFYEWQNGTPGALQYEQSIPASAITLTTDVTGAFGMRIPLPTQFAATGKHFVSVQTVSNLGWSWRTAGTGNVRDATAQVRDRNPATSWQAAGNTDVAFFLYGTLTGPPTLQNLGETTRTPSGRVRIFGTNFGPAATGGEVRIGGQRAIVTRWTNTAIYAYVPEVLAPGTHDVQVITATGSSGVLALNVTNRTSPGGHALWRFEADWSGITSAPVVGPDGTIYVMDDHGNLYALSPDGGLKWATKSGFQGSRLTRGSDGTLYTMADGILRATNPDGTHKWDFAPPDLAWTISGPTVGPDGNVYATSQANGYGFFSVTPAGQLRWRRPEIIDRVPRGHEIVFSEGQAYINHRVAGQSTDELMAFRMTDGALQWRREADNRSQPLIGLGGRIYVDWLIGTWLARVYEPDGSLFSSEQGQWGMRTFSPDRTKFYASMPSGTHMAKHDAFSRAQIWAYDTGISLLGAPTPDPFDRFVLARTHAPGSPGNLFALTSSGEFLWRDDMPSENGGSVILTGGPVFSPNGNIAYTGSVIAGQDANNQYSYLYAFRIVGGDTGSGPAPSGAVSRKTHGGAGAFDIPLPLTGAAGVECRTGGTNGSHRIVVTFERPVTMSGATISNGAAAVSSWSSGGVQAIVDLVNVADNQQIAVTLNVNDGLNSGPVTIPMGILAGDSNGDRTVNTGDALQVRSRSGGEVNANTFRSDVNADGTINSGDTLQVRIRSGNSLP